MLIFSKEIVAKFFQFDEDSHTVQIIGYAPTDNRRGVEKDPVLEEILKYSDGSSNFDVKQLYENFLQCVYQAVNEMSQNPSEENFESLSMDWKPCTFGGKDRFGICLLINDRLFRLYENNIYQT